MAGITGRGGTDQRVLNGCPAELGAAGLASNGWSGPRKFRLAAVKGALNGRVSEPAGIANTLPGSDAMDCDRMHKYA